MLHTLSAALVAATCLLARLVSGLTVSSVASFEYDDSPERLDRYVDSDEVSSLIELDGKPFKKDVRRLVHFLTRVRTTILAYRQQIHNLHRDVQSANIRATSIGTPTSLDPRSAAKFLPPEEIATLADELIKQKFAALDSEAKNLEADRADHLRRNNLLKFAVSSILEDYSLPAEVRNKVASAFEGVLDPVPAPEGAANEAPASTPIATPIEGDGSLDDLFS